MRSSAAARKCDIAAARAFAPRLLSSGDWLGYEALAQYTGKPLEEAKSMHPTFYLDDAWLGLEQERIFKGSWFAAAHASELAQPGDAKVVDVGEDSFILTRDKAGVLHAFYNVCRHRGARLNPPCARGTKQLVCPYHWWSYRLDGSLKSTPPSAQPKERKENLGLKRVPGVEIFAGLIFLNQNPTCKPLQDSLGDLPQKLSRYDFSEMSVHKKKDYNIAANWKLVAENFVDFYHINSVHPGLAKFSRVDHHVPYQGNGQYVGFATDPLTDHGGPGDSSKFNAFPRVSLAEKNAALFFHIFPNVSVTIYPHSVYTLISFPEEPGRTREQLTLLMAPGARLQHDSTDEFTHKCDALMDFVTQVNDEDVTALENLQRGLKGARAVSAHGEFLPEYDWPIHRFQNMVLSSVGATNDLGAALSPSLSAQFEEKVHASAVNL
jgi:phenylpropionate dioxygenase-like ring-hydroxylating dioxygenase large terminal subunit